jgi:histone arginine demethylase JMJD6
MVSGGYWHAVLNLEDTVAVTHNFASPVNLGRVWRHARVGRPKMAKRWYKSIKEKFPELISICDTANADDNFEFDPDKKT